MRNRPKQSDCAEMYVQRELAQIHADIACAPVSNVGKSSVQHEAVEIRSPDFRFRRTSFSPEHTFPYKHHYYVNYYESGEIGSPAKTKSAHVVVGTIRRLLTTTCRHYSVPSGSAHVSSICSFHMHGGPENPLRNTRAALTACRRLHPRERKWCDWYWNLACF